MFKLKISFIQLCCLFLLSVHGRSEEFKYSRITDIPDLSFLPYVFTGLDVLEQMDFEPLRGKSIAILCNQTAVDRKNRHLLDLVRNYQDIEVKILFSPEYGLFSSDDKRMKLVGREGIEPVTGARIVDLFGRYVLPPDWSLSNIDLILVDIQDTGIRYSTYITTVTKIMEVASQWDIPILVLDRPNPIRGDKLDGPVVRTEYQSFEGYHLVPIRHGLTIGEFVLIINEMGWARDLARVDLTIMPMANWKRSMWFDETGLPWNNPVPGISDLETLLAYTGMALLKGTNLNGGQGTDRPFLRMGAPWIASQHLGQKMSNLELPGMSLKTIRYKPQMRAGSKTVPLYNEEFCSGIEIEIIDRDRFDPLLTATSLIIMTHHLYPREFQWIGHDYIDKLFGYNLLRTFAAQGKPPDYLSPLWLKDVLLFEEFRQRFLLYD